MSFFWNHFPTDFSLYCFPSRKEHGVITKLYFDFMSLQQLNYLLTQVGTLNIFSQENTQFYTLH